MKNWKNLCIERIQVPLLKQIILATLLSWIVMSLMVDLLICIFDRTDPESGWTKGVFLIVANFIVFLWMSNVNSLLMQFLYYSRIFPFLFYSWRYVFVESILFAVLCYLLVKVDIDVPENTYGIVFFLCLPEILTIVFILAIRCVFKQWFDKMNNKYISLNSGMKNRRNYYFNRGVDTAIGILIPLIFIIISLVIL